MFHLLKLENIKHLDINGSVLWEEDNINNVFHQDGELFLLSVAFNTGGGITVPANYYL